MDAQFVVNPAQSTAMLRLMAVRAGNMRPVFTVVRDMMLRDQRRNFDSRGGVFGDRWAALSPLTRGSEPLVDTGRLAAAARGGKGKVTRISKSTVRVGINSDIFYARFHQAGAPAGSRKGTLPQRDVVGINDQTSAKSITLIQRYLLA